MWPASVACASQSAVAYSFGDVQQLLTTLLAPLPSLLRTLTSFSLSCRGTMFTEEAAIVANHETKFGACCRACTHMMRRLH